MNCKPLCVAGAASAALALFALAVPAQAQLGGLLGRVANEAASKTDSANGCPKGKKRSAGSRIAGGILGSMANSAAGSVGGVFNFVPISGLTDQLTAAIACKLDPEEQKQAAQATLDATRGVGDEAEVDVGTSAAWTSQTREDVSGTSTVIARDDDAELVPGQGRGNGHQCITVTDVIIVKGEETRADKRMCRQPPAKRYALLA